ncbi:MAG: hypothetical protein OEZ02_02535, partial [Anaerolineae bacterium]|nr:hypothetical protein [Anaerolineae bacterium]
ALPAASSFSTASLEKLDITLSNHRPTGVPDECRRPQQDTLSGKLTTAAAGAVKRTVCLV